VPQVHAFLWDRGVLTDLGALPGQLSTYSQAFAINDHGQVVGESGIRDSEGHPFVWSKGVMTDIGTLGGPTGSAQAINNKGQVVGYADTTVPDPSNPGGVISHAFIWAGGNAQDLGSDRKDAGSQANGINNHGQIVGFSVDNAGFRAVLWQGGTIIDLGTRIPAHSGWKLSGANAITDRGQIVGVGVNPHGRTDAFLLTP
jgi:probable HAF family extracellular repeat protein